ncbi:MAG: hypothetical protein HQL63_15105 [Magnetococcales bacterium]|nr:hypothetical protein [Magnetococcales bacterium]
MQQTDLVRSQMQNWSVAGRGASQPVNDRAAQVIRQAFSSGDMVTLSVPDTVKGAIRDLAEKTLSELPPNDVSSILDLYA